MISGVILARNEQANIVDCLRSLRPHVGEILLVDMESSDRTVELARPFVSKVLPHPLIPNFDSARNLAIPEARFDWLWFLDADERVPEATGQLVCDIVRTRGDEFVALTIPFKTYFCGQWIEHSGWWPGYTMPRVLKRGHFRFGEALHSGVQFSGRELRIAPRPDLAIEHYSYRSLEHYLEKLNRYTTGEAIHRSQHGLTPDWRRGIREMVRDLWLYYERNEGALDRYRGWVLAWLSGQYRWLTEAKLLDRPEQYEAIEQAAIPADLDEVFALAQQELWRLRGDAPGRPWEVHLASPLRDPSGYADDGRTLLKALALGERKASAAEITWNDKRIELPLADAGLINTLVRQPPQASRITVSNCIPTLCAPDPEARINVLRTAFETDRIPEGWLERLEAYDEIWVCSRQNERSFRRSGVAPERLQRLPQAVDTSLFCPQGEVELLPPALAGRFLFLSVFEWQLRKGWDLLLRAYCQEFAPTSQAGLLLKVSRLHGQSLEMVHRQAAAVLAELGQSLEDRPDIVMDQTLRSPAQMAALYRAASALVLPSRGEGWGRPYLEAMACGIPVIGTRGNGSDDFLTEENSFLVSSSEVDVPPEAAREIPVYAGHHWREPSEASLRGAMCQVFNDRSAARGRAQVALTDVQERFSIPALASQLAEKLAAVESALRPQPVPPAGEDQIRVELAGELFAGHSFSNINERLARGLGEESTLALSVQRVLLHPPEDDRLPASRALAPWIDRPLPGETQVTIRHAYPPNWQPPVSGKWVHIQPWEFGVLPRDWLAPLRDQVDEIWAPSHYVRDVYVRSGVPEHKIQVIPWGIDPHVYQPGLPERILPTDKSFRFLFVGGTLARKGFDLALEAYRQEFSRDEDVCLVIKDVGTQTFYRIGNLRERVFQTLADPQAPTIVYFDQPLTDGQRASLYCACHCLVAPYRGEGFGLPILEAMACGIPPIVPRGGPSDDYTSDVTAIRLPADVVPCPHDWEPCGQPTELQVRLDTLRRAMREAYENRQRLQQLGEAASQHVRSHFTWRQSLARMVQRLHVLAGRDSTPPAPVGRWEGIDFAPLDLAVCLLTENSEERLPDCLSRLRPFVRQLVVGDLGSTDRSRPIAQEYGAELVDLTGSDRSAAAARLREHCTAGWILELAPQELLSEVDLEHLAAVIDGARPDEQELSAPHSNGAAEQNQRWLLHRNTGRAGDRPANFQPATHLLPHANGKRVPSAPRSAAAALDVAVVTVGYNVPGATKALLESALRDSPHRVSFCIFSHSRIPEKVAELSELARRPDVLFRDYGVNRGLAKSWNEGILWAFDHQMDVVLVVNEDVLFAPGDLAKLAECARALPDRFLVTARCYHEDERRWDSSEYGCFAVGRLALDILGCFDENFFPVYCEDSDYRRRAALAGLATGYCGDTALCHCGSASLRDPLVARQNTTTYAANRAYFARKWGGDPGQEVFSRPFDDPRFGLYIDPAVRDAPYPHFNRTDQHLVLV